MDQKTKATLIKMLGMTASSHDGEALVAIRKANALLAESNMNWHEFLMSFRISDQSYMTPPSKRKSQERGQERGQGGARRAADWGNVNSAKNDAQHTDGDEINRLFESAYANTSPRSSFYEFMDSVHDFWTQRGYLTVAQYQAIKRAAQ